MNSSIRGTGGGILCNERRPACGMSVHKGKSVSTKHQPVHVSAKRETVETPKAPGSASDFTGLPKDRAEIPIRTPTTSRQMQEHIELVRSDFPVVFKDILDLQHFERKLFFSDPITRVSFFRGYQFVVQFLRFFLAPIYELQEVCQIGDQEILVKWSWTMNFWWNRYTPLKYFWDPRFAFTGITLLGYKSQTGKWNKHVDAWDAIENNEFFSLEGFLFAFKQMARVDTPPNRFTPEFQIYKKYKDWEIRRYRPFITAEISLDDLMASSVAVGAGPGIKEQTGCAQMEKAEALLERYLALGNDREEFFELTTPLFISEENTYSLMVPGYKSIDDLPKPHKSDLVRLKQHPERFYAAVVFSGRPSEADIQDKAQFLRHRLSEEGSKPTGDSWVFARYNKEGALSPKGPFRRNDLLVPLQDSSVSLWRGVDWAFIDRVARHPV